MQRENPLLKAESRQGVERAESRPATKCKHNRSESAPGSIQCPEPKDLPSVDGQLGCAAGHGCSWPCGDSGLGESLCWMKPQGVCMGCATGSFMHRIGGSHRATGSPSLTSETSQLILEAMESRTQTAPK